MTLERSIEEVVTGAVRRALEEHLPPATTPTRPMPGGGKPMNSAEAAEYLRIDRHALGRLVRSGQLQHKRIGNRHVFREEWLIAFLERPDAARTKPLTGRTRLELHSTRGGVN